MYALRLYETTLQQAEDIAGLIKARDDVEDVEVIWVSSMSFVNNRVIVGLADGHLNSDYTESDFAEVGRVDIDAPPYLPVGMLVLILPRKSKQDVLNAVVLLRERGDVKSADVSYRIKNPFN
jgi:hypothetical protein